MHAPNHVEIRLRYQNEPPEFRVDIFPPFPEVRAGHEPLLVTVDWSQNGGFCKLVELHSFLGPAGTPADIIPNRVGVSLGDKSEKTLLFNFTVQERIPIKFSLTLHRVHPAEAFTIDPGVILKPYP